MPSSCCQVCMMRLCAPASSTASLLDGELLSADSSDGPASVIPGMANLKLHAHAPVHACPVQLCGGCVLASQAGSILNTKQGEPAPGSNAAQMSASLCAVLTQHIG